MYLAVSSVCESHQADWVGSVAYGNAVVRFQSKILLIRDIVEVQETPLTGISKDKMNAREAMKVEALLVSGAVTAYATITNNQQLKNAVHFTATDLMRDRDTLASERARIIHDQAISVVGSLADYGVTAVTLTSLMDKIVAFEALLVAPRVAIVDKKGATSSLKALMSEADALLRDEMDVLMPPFLLSAPVFYDAYFNARIIVDTGSIKPSVVILVTAKDALTGIVLSDVDLSAGVEGKPDKVYNATVRQDGRLRIALPASAIGNLANVNLRALKAGYDQSLLTLAVLPKTEYEVKMLMKPTPVPTEGA